MIVAGWDPKKGGQVYGCPIGGTLAVGEAEQKGWAVDGSGSTYIWGYLDAHWKPEGMTREDAEALCVEALALAMARDGSSGGVVRLVTVDGGRAGGRGGGGAAGAPRPAVTERFLRGDEIPLFGDELLPPGAKGLLARKGVDGGVDAADMRAGGAGGGGAGGGAPSGMVVG
jgi:20S proteasome subunit beta 1